MYNILSKAIFFSQKYRETVLGGRIVFNDCGMQEIILGGGMQRDDLKYLSLFYIFYSCDPQFKKKPKKNNTALA